MKTTRSTHVPSSSQSRPQATAKSAQEAPSVVSPEVTQKAELAETSVQKKKQFAQLLGKEEQSGDLVDSEQTQGSSQTLKLIPGTTQPLLDGQAVSGKSTHSIASKGITLAEEAKQLGCEVEKYKLGPYTVNIIKVGSERFPKDLVKKALDAINRCPTRFQRIQKESKGNDQIDVFLGDIDAFIKTFNGHPLIGTFVGQLKNSYHDLKRDENHPGNGHLHGKAFAPGAYDHQNKKELNDAYNAVFIDPSNETLASGGRVKTTEPEWKQVHDLALLLSHEMTHATTNHGHNERPYPGVDKELDALRTRLENASSTALSRFTDAYKSPLMADGSPFQTFLRDGWEALNATDPARAKDEYIRAWNWIMSGSNVTTGTIRHLRENNSTLKHYINATYTPTLMEMDFILGKRK